MSSLPSELEPLAATLCEPSWRRTASETWRWLAAHSVADEPGERRLPVLVTVASVYACLCGPERASERCHDVAARFTLLFFLVDDASEGELPNLLAADASWSIGRYTGALRAWLNEFSEQASSSHGLRQRFARAYHDYLAARRAEHGHQRRPLGLEEHWAFRRRSIFMDPYLDMWMMLLGIDVEALDEPAFAQARAIAVDLVLLANDLGSLERDRRGGASPDDLNLVHALAREHRVSEAEALERLLAQHDQLVQRYRSAVERAVAARSGRHAELYRELLSSVIEGNVGSLRALGFRYPGAGPVLARLASVRG